MSKRIGNLSVLWADDQEEFVRASVPVIEEWLADYEWVRNGTETLEALRGRSWDLLLLDLKMPPGEWGGLYVLEAGSDLIARLPVIVLSGAGSLRECIRAQRLGASDYIQKEQVEAELRAVVIRVLERWSARHAGSDYDRIRELELTLHELIIGVLKREAVRLAHRDIFQALVPKEIAIKTYSRLLDVGRGSQEQYMDLLDLGKILAQHWNNVQEFGLLERHLPSNRRADRLKWLEDLNELRNVVAHPMRGELNLDERTRLSEIEQLVVSWESTLEKESGAARGT